MERSWKKKRKQLVLVRVATYASLMSFSRRPKSGKGQGEIVAIKTSFVEEENLSFDIAVDQEGK